MRKIILVLTCMVLLAVIASAGTTLAQTSGTVTRSVSNSQPAPGEVVTVSITPSGFDAQESPFYAVKEELGSLIFSGDEADHTADDYDMESRAFFNMPVRAFDYKVTVPETAKAGDQFVITGEFWTEYGDERDIGQTVITVAGGVGGGRTLPGGLPLHLDNISYVQSKTVGLQLPDDLSWVNNDTVLIVEDRTMSEGSTVQIPINLVNARNISNMDITLTYDPEVLQATEVLQGSLTATTLFESNIMDGKVLIAFASNTGVGTDGTGSVALLRFDVVGNKGDSSILEFTVAKGNDFTTRAEIDLTTQNGLFTVDGDELKGDCDGDGDVDYVDTEMALRMAVAKIEARLIADMNDDGQVTSFDADEILILSGDNLSAIIDEIQIEMKQLGLGQP